MQPIYATRYFSYQFDRNIEIVCSDCEWYIHCEDNSNSMYPTFGCNDTLIVAEPRNKKEIETGDIVIYWNKEKWVIHRVVNIDYKNHYVTKGDNNMFSDSFHPSFYDIKFIVKGVIYD